MFVKTESIVVPGKSGIPLGVRLFQLLPSPPCFSRLIAYRIFILSLTYFLYVVYHIVRKPLGVVKNVLHQNCTGLPRPPTMSDFEYNLHNMTWCEWAPFDHDSKSQFSALDFSYRFAYAIGVFIAGPIAERLNLRFFITWGMIFSGLWIIFQGMAYFWSIHALSFFVVAQILSGICQGTGWPSVVTLIGNWFGKHRRGLLFGVWNSCTSVGNIIGTIIAAAFVQGMWGYSFVVPGIIMVICGGIAYFFAIIKPEDVGLPTPKHEDFAINEDLLEKPVIMEAVDLEWQNDKCTQTELLGSKDITVDKRPITIREAASIPGIFEFSMALFFCKAVFYSFFFWLPVYIKAVAHVDSKDAGDISALFDAGGIIGSITAGFLSDYTGAPATVCGTMFLLAIPLFVLMMEFVSRGLSALIVFLIVIGLFVNGPYTLITTAVATELGTRPSLVKNTKALTTVAAIVDGFGTMGSAFGPLIAGLLSEHGWKAVFIYLIIAQIVAFLCVSRLMYHDIMRWVRSRRLRKTESSAAIL